MKRPMNDVQLLRWTAGALAFAAAIAFALSPAVAQPRRPARGRRPSRPMLKPGTEAPDFELPSLVIEKDKSGKKVGKTSKEKVKLSSFRGKKVVCIFSSSYT